MTDIRSVKDVTTRLEQIREHADDDEAAHGLEDALYKDVLRAIAEGLPQFGGARALAGEALKAAEIDFARWYA